MFTTHNSERWIGSASLPQNRHALAALHRKIQGRSRTKQVLGSLWCARTKLAVLCADLVLSAFSYTLAANVLVGFEGEVWVRRVLTTTLLPLLVLRLGGFVLTGVFRSPFRYASIPDFVSILKAVSLSGAVFYILVRLCVTHIVLSPLLFVLDWTFLILLLSGLHFSVRFYDVQRALHRKNGKRVVIVGAGDAGMTVLKELALDSSSMCRPVAVVDDDPRKQNTAIWGVPVIGTLAELSLAVRAHRAEEILICIPSATRSQMSRILAACRECAIPIRTLPSLGELVNGTVSRRDLRSIRTEDVLQREEVHCDPEAVAKVVRGKTVLVTGAGGTIGSELCRQIAAAAPRMLLLLDKSENGLFYIHLELRERFPEVSTKPLLVDVARAETVRKTLVQERPEIVFHAAAHKHVGLMEIHPQEAIRNNVLGTRNVALAAMEARVERFVNISTDKAVAPRSYMGLSKKLTELLIQELARQSSTRYMNVRFGNVAGSAGSVLRIFWDQIEKGGPLRVTDPGATRYFMSVSEAVYLIFCAAAQGEGGETFIFDMGEPINIYKLARTVSLFSGYVPEQELPIQFIGLREGEKMHEQLWETWERPKPTAHRQILAITDPNPRSFQIVEQIQHLESCLVRDDRAGLFEWLHSIVPNFRDDPAVHSNAVIPGTRETLETREARS